MRIQTFLIYCFILTIIFTLLVQYKFHDIFSSSPFVELQQIGDPVNDMNFENSPCTIHDSTNENPFTYNSDITGITYLSDGKLLNATMWLKKTQNTGVPSEGQQDVYPQLNIYVGNSSKFSFLNVSKDFFSDFFNKTNYEYSPPEEPIYYGDENFKIVEINFTPNWGYRESKTYPNVSALFLLEQEKFIALVYDFPEDIWDYSSLAFHDSYIPFHKSVNQLFNYLKNNISSLADYTRLTYGINQSSDKLPVPDESLIFDDKRFKKYLLMHSDKKKIKVDLYSIMVFQPFLDENLLPTKYFMIIDIISNYDKGIDYIVTHEERIKLYDYFSRGYGIPITGDPRDSNISDLKNITINSLIKQLGQYGIFDNYVIKKINITEQKINQKNNEYIDFNFDLGIANYPSQYKLIFGKIVEAPYGGCSVIDLTNWISIPSPEFNITISPNSIDLRPDEKKDIQLHIKSMTNLNSNVSILIPTTNNLKISSKIDNTYISPFGSGIANLEIEQLKNNREYGNYVLPINLSINFPGKTLVKVGLKNISTTSTDSVIVTKNFLYNLRLLPNYNFSEYLEMASGYASSLNNITGFLLGISPFIVTIILRKYKKSERVDYKNS